MFVLTLHYITNNNNNLIVIEIVQTKGIKDFSIYYCYIQMCF